MRRPPTARLPSVPGASVVPALLVATLLALSGCSAPSTPAPNGPPTVRTGHLGGQAVQAVVPASGTTVRGLVVYLHGLDEDAGATTSDADLSRVVTALARAGFVVVSSDAGGDSFGSPAARADYLDLVRTARSRYHTKATFLLAESMGALSALPLAASGKVPDLDGTVGISPAVSVSAPSAQPYLFAATAAWGRAPTAADDVLNQPTASFAGQHFRFYVTPGDTTVPTAQHAGAFEKRFGNVASVSLVGCTGQHVDPSCFQPTSVVSWIESLLNAS